MICKQCKKYGKCGKPYSSISNYAEKCKDFEKQKQTNFEAIKNMSIDEMAKFLDKIDIGKINISQGFCDVCKNDGGCWKCTLEWLKSEVEK